MIYSGVCTECGATVEMQQDEVLGNITLPICPNCGAYDTVELVAQVKGNHADEVREADHS